jgi:hypothetical protein
LRRQKYRRAQRIVRMKILSGPPSRAGLGVRFLRNSN